jgi:phosphate:Na+ symporter
MVDGANPMAVIGLIFGGVMSLLYGVQIITKALQRDAGTRLRHLLMVLAGHPLAAFVIGVFITLLTQSSAAVSSLLVGLVSTQLLTLASAIITLFGSDVGSALVVQLLILDITSYAFVLLGIGAAAAMLARETRWRSMGEALFGFGLVILGLYALKEGSTPLAGNPLTVAVLDALGRTPLILVLVGMVLSMVFASSVAGVGLVIVLAANRTLPLAAALALMLGTNVGTTITAMLTALSSGSVSGKRLALIHMGTKLAIALIALALLNPLSMLLSQAHLPPSTIVALSHLGFNLVLAVGFTPLTGPLVRLAMKLVPEKPRQDTTGPRYLTPDALAVPAVALSQATREILHVTDVIMEMQHLSIAAFEQNGLSVGNQIAALDDQLDELVEAIKHYLAQLDEETMTHEQRRRRIELLYMLPDLEAMGDILDKQYMRIARRKHRRQLIFSKEGWDELMLYHHEVTEAMQQAFAALTVHDSKLADDFFRRKKQIGRMRQQLRFRHLRRLQLGISPSLETSAIHLDFLGAMDALLAHASTIAHVIRGDLDIRFWGREDAYGA